MWVDLKPGQYREPLRTSKYPSIEQFLDGPMPIVATAIMGIIPDQYDVNGFYMIGSEKRIFDRGNDIRRWEIGNNGSVLSPDGSIRVTRYRDIERKYKDRTVVEIAPVIDPFLQRRLLSAPHTLPTIDQSDSRFFLPQELQDFRCNFDPDTNLVVTTRRFVPFNLHELGMHTVPAFPGHPIDETGQEWERFEPLDGVPLLYRVKQNQPPYHFEMTDGNTVILHDKDGKKAEYFTVKGVRFMSKSLKTLRNAFRAIMQQRHTIRGQAIRYLINPYIRLAKVN